VGYYEQFRDAAIERGIPGDEVDTFAEHLRFVIQMSGPASNTQVAWRSGGLPRLPAGMAWPTVGAHPLPFVASVDCAALPTVDRLPLPSDGSLLFFLEHEQDLGTGKYAKVLYVPAGVDTAVAEPPDYADPFYCNPEIPFVGEEFELYAEVATELPLWFDDDDEAREESESVERVMGALPHAVELRALANELWPWKGRKFGLGGYDTQPRSGISEPTLEMADYDYEEQFRLKREWVTLACFDTADDELYVGYFLIRFDDLAAGRFDKVRSFTTFLE
jgi:hypothetical protein